MIALIMAVAVPADPTHLSQYLSQDGIGPKESQQFLATVKRAADAYRKTPPDGDPLKRALSEVGVLIKAHHLRGDQALELFGGVWEEINPRFSAASPALLELEKMMRQHKVPGPELYDYLLPSLRHGMQTRLHRQKTQALDLSQLQKASAFASRYGLPAGQLISQLQQLRLELKKAEEGP